MFISYCLESGSPWVLRLERHGCPENTELIVFWQSQMHQTESDFLFLHASGILVGEGRKEVLSTRSNAIR